MRLGFLIALLCLRVVADGFIVKTNGSTQIGAGGGLGSAGDGYITRTNSTTVIGGGGGSGSAGDGYYTVTNGTTLVGSGGGGGNPGNDTGVAGMAYYWNYSDLATSANVSTWLDRIQSVDAHQGDATKQPTNSSSGVWFNASRLTNVNFTLPSSTYSIWIVFKPNRVAGGTTYYTLISDKGGLNGFFQKTSSLDYYYSADHALATLAATVSYDFLYSNAGSGSAGGGVGYTNGVATGTITDKAVTQTFGCIGSDDSNEAFQGYIKFIGIWTNVVLTSGNAATLYSYSQAH